eukprot:g1153.t1
MIRQLNRISRTVSSVTSLQRRSAAFSTSHPGEGSFRVLGLQQIAIGGPSKTNLSNLWCDLFGLQKTGTYKSESENVDEDILSLGGANGDPSDPFAIEIDLMQPLDPEKRPRVDSPPLNHIGLWVDDIHGAVEQLTAKGVRFTPGGIRKGASGHLVTFIHPKGNSEAPLSGEGVLIELVQAPPSVIQALAPSSV